jgi:predicted ATP-grasp superfamily ATP-dependent carboligase
MAASHTVRLCFDKHRLYEVARAIDIPTAPWREYGCDWLAAARDMGYPVVVKRRDSALKVHDKKALTFASEAALALFLNGVRHDPDPGSLLLQKFAPGWRHNCHVAADRGRLVVYFQQKVLRTDELDGSGLGVEGISVAPSVDLYRHCERLVARLGYHGVGCIQFLVDEGSGEAALLEFNPRMDSTAALPYRLGLDFPRVALQLASPEGFAAEVPPRPYALGRRYAWLYGDLMHWQGCLRRGEQTPAQLAVWALAMLRASVTGHHLTWEWTDPLPTLLMFWRRVQRVFGRALPGLPRENLRTAK